ncbi:MAG: aspartate aminotransferase family protein [Halobacteriales archaeon]
MSEHNFIHSEKPIPLARGEGPYLYDEDGTEYLDFGASYACTPLGHCHPDVTDAVTEQLETLTFVQASFPVEARERAYAALAATAPGRLENVWFCNSGTEANEAALKFARSATGDSKVVATMQGFHGRTMGALATTWPKKYREPFEPLMGDVEFVPYGEEEAMAEAVDSDTAAVIVEPIQGEGGINLPPEGYLEAVRGITGRAGAAMIVDEVQAGNGRTGEFWAVEHTNAVPDVVTTAKGLGNGLPIGAALCADWIAEESGSHNSTFSGGPAVAAAVDATVSTIVTRDLPGHAAEMGAYLTEEIEAAIGDSIREVRGEGLLLGVELKRGANRVARDLAIQENVFVLPAGRTVVRLLPPLTIGEAEADTAVEALTEVIE